MESKFQMTLKTLSLLIIIMAISLLSGCTKKQDPNEKVAHFYHNAKVKGMDPAFTNDRYSSMEVARIYEGLLEFHYLKRPYVLQANLAAKMPEVSTDGLLYTFKIKKGVYFHNDKSFPSGKGRELIAQDFIYSIKRLADPMIQSTGWWMLDGKIVGLNEWRKNNESANKVNYDQDVEGLKALDKYTLQFKLIKPYPQFLYSLATPFTFATAREVVEFYGKTFLNHPVGTGAFMLPVFNQTNKIVYKKNPNFRDKFYPTEGEDGDREKGFLKDANKKLPFVNKVITHIMVENQTRWLNFQKGKLDYIGIPKDNFASAVTPDNKLMESLAHMGIQLEVVPRLDVTYTAFNHLDPLFKNNVKLRQAMALAHNSSESNRLFFGGRAYVAQSIIPPGIAGNIKGFKNTYRKHDIEKAKKLLAEAGYPGGKGLPIINYDNTSSSSARQMGEFFARSMREIGVNIKVRLNTWPELSKKVNTRQTQLYGMAWNADYPDAENFFQLLYSKNAAPGSNGSNYSDPYFDKLFEKAIMMQDSPARTKIYQELNRYVAQQMPWIFNVHRMNFTIKQGWLRNFKVTEFEQHQELYVDIDLELKKKLLKKM